MEKQWAQLTPEEKRRIRLERWLSDNTKFVSPEAEQSFRARETRINDAIQLKVPDRVPVYLQDLCFFPARYTGQTFQKIMYDSQALVAAYKKTIVDFEPDMYWDPSIPTPGKALEILDCKQLQWPGHGLPENRPFQYVEGEYMKADEYDDFINDPTEFIISRYIPQLLGVMEPLKTLPSLKNFLFGYQGIPISSAFVKPEVISAFKAFYKAGLIMQKHDSAIDSFNREMKGLGFPLSFWAATVAPFDVLSDTLRGMRGVMLDMYRRPEKLLEAMEKVTPFLIEFIISETNKKGHPRAILFIHRAADNFMSAKQFETFYWPGYKKLILACIDEGITPLLFLEGDMTSRLKYFAELPKGKALGLFDSTDPVKAKEILGDTMCISGLMPLSLLQTGTPDQVKEYARKLIDVVGKGGGFIMGPRSVMDEANPELVKVWVDFTKEYGVYN